MACRFCLETTQTKDNPLWNPCVCKGSVKYVHKLCLKRWRLYTDNELFKNYCQLCLSPFILPSRWQRQSILFCNHVVWYILQKSYLFVVLTQVAHTQLVVDEPYWVYYTSPDSTKKFQRLLFLNTSLYLVYYTYLFCSVTEKCVYLDFAWNKPSRFPLLLVLLALNFLSATPPFGQFYLILLPNILDIHRTVIQDMNTAAELN